jgi:AcrR family transcriptional regulator
MSLREAGKEARRQRILDAAAAIVEEGGLDALTMRRLSDTAGVSYATVYNLVGGKEDVLVAVLQSELARLSRELAALETKNPIDHERELVAGLVDHCVARPRLYRPLVLAVHAPAAGGRGLPIRRRTIATHERLIREAIARGLLVDDLDAAVLARHVTLAVNGVLRRWASGETRRSEFRAEADYALLASLLGVASPSTRKRLLTELRKCERALSRSSGRAA